MPRSPARRFLATALTGLALLLGGCIAQYRIATDETTADAPDLAQSCRYQWQFDLVEYRTRDNNDHGWTDPANVGFSGLRRELNELAGRCPSGKTAGAPAARASAHYIEYSKIGRAHV